MIDDDFAWRIETACGNACPSPREIVIGTHWLLRLSGGATRRTNAVSPLRAGTYDPTPIIRQAQRIYHAQAQPMVFRVPTIAPGMDAPLERAGLIASGEVSTLLARIDAPNAIDPEVEMASEPSPDWLAAKFRLTPKVGAAPDVYKAMIAAVILPKAFAALSRQGRIAGVALSRQGRIAGVAYGAVHDAILVIGSVVVDPQARRRGYGRRVVASLMRWARREGARHACLQVEADNVAALALYRAVGFETEAYRYHYRSEP